MLSKQARKRMEDYEGTALIQRTMTEGFPPPKGMPNIEGYHKIMGLDLIEPEELEWYKGNMLWGTHGPTGKDPLRWVRLIDCETVHLENIMMTQHLPAVMKKVILSILKDRWSNNGSHT